MLTQEERRALKEQLKKTGLATKWAKKKKYLTKQEIGEVMETAKQMILGSPVQSISSQEESGKDTWQEKSQPQSLSEILKGMRVKKG